MSPDLEPEVQAPVPEPPLRPTLRQRLPLRDLLVQSFAIVGSVLLAFGINEWRADQNDADLAHRTLEAYHREVAANLRTIQAFLPYHEALLDSLQHVRLDTVSSTETLFQAINWTGPRQVFLTDNARQMSNATGAAALMDYEIAYTLTALYSLQDRLEHIQRTSIETIMMPGTIDDTRVKELAYTLMVYMEMVTEFERYLQHEGYPQTLAALETHLGPAPRSTDASPPDSAAVAR